MAEEAALFPNTYSSLLAEVDEDQLRDLQVTTVATPLFIICIQ
jgi:hypothetical protein